MICDLKSSLVHARPCVLPCSARNKAGSQRRYATRAAQETLQAFPQTYIQAVRDAREATQAALKDGAKLIEVEFPTGGLDSVCGDDDGCAEMNASLGFLRTFCQPFQQQAANTRIFFPDADELRVAQEGRAMDPAAGSAKLDPVFDSTNFALDYLTKPNFLSDAGINIGQPNVLDRIRDGDELYVFAYPSFNVNEILAIADLYEGSTRESGKPMIVFNGELDRVRSGYYPSLFYPKVGKLAKTFVPQFTTAYYIHNFKGSRGGALFRAYPGPWQVLRRYAENKLQVVHTQDDMPTLKQVACDILPDS